MINGKTFLAVIPARKGSKRLPRKNLINFCGKPLVQWTIEAAIAASYLDNIVVSSDDDEVLALADQKKVGFIRRPGELAGDTSSSFSVVRHVLCIVEKSPDYVVLLQPTSPLRTGLHIDESIKLLETKAADAIISVCETEHSPLWCNVLPDNGDMRNFLSETVRFKRSQDLPVFYRLNGAIYVCNVEKLLQQETFFLEQGTFAYGMSRVDSVDIDTEVDLYLAEAIMRSRGAFCG